MVFVVAYTTWLLLYRFAPFLRPQFATRSSLFIFLSLRTSKVEELNFYFYFGKGGRWNLYFSLNGQNRPKIGFCRVFVMAFVESNLKNERFHDSLFSLKTLYLGKFWFISYRPKCYCPIRFTKEPITYVWRVFWDSI